MKTLEEIKVEFGRKFTFLNDLNQYKVGYRNRNGDDCMFGPQKVWNYIESTILQTKQELIEDKNARDNRIHKEGFNVGYKKGYKDGLKNVSGWSKEYEKMMLENL